MGKHNEHHPDIYADLDDTPSAPAPAPTRRRQQLKGRPYSEQQKMVSVREREAAARGAGSGASDGGAGAAEGAATKAPSSPGLTGPSDTELAASGGGIDASKSLEKPLPNGDTQTTKIEAGGGISADGQITANGGVGVTRKGPGDGDLPTGASVKGSVTAANGHLRAVSGEGSATHRGVSATLKGGYRLIMSQPKLVETVRPKGSDDKPIERWRVGFTLETSVGGGVKGGNKHGSAGPNGGYKGTESGSKFFGSAAAAWSFINNASALSPGDLGFAGMPDVDQALKMQTGQSGGDSTGFQIGANGTLNISVGSVGAGASRDKTTKTDFSYKGGGIMQITTQRTVAWSGNASGGVPLVSANAGRSKVEFEVVTVEFDLNQAEGKAAYDAWRSTRQLPASSGPGVKIVAKTKGVGDASSAGVGLALMDGSDTGGVVESNTDADGESVRTIVGRNTRATNAAWGENANHQHAIVIQQGKGDASYAINSALEGNRLSDLNKGLADAGNGTTDMNVEGLTDDEIKARRQRKWHVDTSYSTKDMRRFVDAAKASKTHDFRPPAVQLRKDLDAAAGNPRLEQLALAKYMRDGGHNAAREIRSWAGRGSSFVQLEGDWAMTGEAGQQQLGARIAEWERDIANATADKIHVARQVGAALMAEKRRMNRIADPKQYKELPRQLRDQEVSRASANIGRLTALMRKAEAFAAPLPGQPAPKLVDPNAEPCTAEQLDTYNTCNTVMNAIKLKAEQQRITCSWQRGIHSGDWRQWLKSARQKVGNIPLVKKAYKVGDAAWAAGEKAWAAGLAAEGGISAATSATWGASVTAMGEARQHYKKAYRKFESANKAYKTIYQALGDDHPAAFHGYKSNGSMGRLVDAQVKADKRALQNDPYAKGVGVMMPPLKVSANTNVERPVPGVIIAEIHHRIDDYTDRQTIAHQGVVYAFSYNKRAGSFTVTPGKDGVPKTYPYRDKRKPIKRAG